MLKKFNSAWADNGDKISLHYTGIGSTHTEYIFYDSALLNLEKEPLKVPLIIK